MITGDHDSTALAVGREIGLVDISAEAINGPKWESLSLEEK